MVLVVNVCQQLMIRAVGFQTLIEGCRFLLEVARDLRACRVS